MYIDSMHGLVQSCAPKLKVTSKIISSQVSSSGKYTGSVTDCSGNKSTCSISVKKVDQYKTQTCTSYSYGTSCSAWGEYSGCNYYSDASNNTTTSCEACGYGSNYKCKTRSCWNYRNGCTSWSAWSNTWTDTSKCSPGVSSDYSTNTKCQTIYREG